MFHVSAACAAHTLPAAQELVLLHSCSLSAVQQALRFCMSLASAVDCPTGISNAGPARAVQCLPPDMLQINSCPSLWGPRPCCLRPECAHTIVAAALLHPDSTVRLPAHHSLLHAVFLPAAWRPDFPTVPSQALRWRRM